VDRLTRSAWLDGGKVERQAVERFAFQSCAPSFSHGHHSLLFAGGSLSICWEQVDFWAEAKTTLCHATMDGSIVAGQGQMPGQIKVQSSSRSRQCQSAWKPSMKEHQALFSRTFKDKWTKTASVHQSRLLRSVQFVCLIWWKKWLPGITHTTARPPRIGPIAADFRDGAALAK